MRLTDLRIILRKGQGAGLLKDTSEVLASGACAGYDDQDQLQIIMVEPPRSTHAERDFYENLKFHLYG